MEWNGEKGLLRYYDKQAQENVTVEDGFTFLLLDQLSTVKGWHDASESGIFSNEVRNTKEEVLTVKAFKGGVLAEGIYSKIKDRVGSLGGSFVANLYVAFKEGNDLKIGSVQFKGAALSAWSDFKNEHRGEIFAKAVQVKGFNTGKKGRIEFRTPIFHLKDISPETNEAATELDRKLQAYLSDYFKKPKATESFPEPEPEFDTPAEEPEGSDIPF